jgi:hypothetical protein
VGDDASMTVPAHRRTTHSPINESATDETPARRAERLARISVPASTQQGLVTRRQLRDAGWSSHQVDHEIRYGRWASHSTTVVALQTGPLSAEQLPWLGVLHAGSGSALTHATATEQAGLRWHRQDNLVHVMTAKGDLVPALDGFFFHQTRRPFQRWLDPDACPARIRLEHAACLQAERQRGARVAIGLVAAVVQQGLSTAERMERAAAQIRKLKHGRVLQLALGDIAGGAESFAEIDVGRLCEESGLMAPTRQSVRLDKEGRRRYLDCEWRLADGRRIALEVDGGFHRSTEHWWRDMRRERAIVTGGTQVLRCSSFELRISPDDIVEDLRLIGVPVRRTAA